MLVTEIDLQTLRDETFASLCHALLFEEHGTVYKPHVEGGPDSGIDGFIEDYLIIYQFKFFKARPRPSTFLKDIDKVAHHPQLKRWILLIPTEPTKRLYYLIGNEKSQRSFDVDVLGKTWILSKLDKYEHIKERFFPQIAKEASVKKILSHSEQAAKRQEEILEEIKKSKRPIKTSVERPSDSLTPEHIRDIADEIKRIEEVSEGKYPFQKVFAQLKNKFRVSNWHLIKDKQYGDVMTWLNRYYHGVKVPVMSPSQIRKSLQGVIKAQQKMLDLRDKEYRELLLQIIGKSSTTQMDLTELERVKYRFNILLGQKPD